MGGVNMRLHKCQIQNYKIIHDAGEVEIDRLVTALVGKNESGKTGVLRALWKSRNNAQMDFDKLRDFPRSEYSRERKNNQYVAHAFFSLDDMEATSLSATVGHTGPMPSQVQQDTWYQGEDKTGRAISIPALAYLRKTPAAAQGIVRTVLGAFTAAGTGGAPGGENGGHSTEDTAPADERA